MTREHELFERLAGAVALGEATEAERARLDAHALSCEACRTGADFGRFVAAAIGASREDETWRPSLEGAVAGRIRASRARRSALTVAALGWAVAASIVLNVAFGSGFAAQLATAFHETGVTQSRLIATGFSEKRDPFRYP